MVAPHSKFLRDRVNSILEVGRHAVLLHIFTCGTPNKLVAMPIHQYLKHLPQDSTANYLRLTGKDRRFNRSESQQVHRDPSCNTFDITLLCKVIKLACEDVADYNSDVWITPSTQMEYYVTAIKNERNDSSHGGREMTPHHFLNTVSHLRRLYLDALMATKDRYGRPDSELATKTREVEDELDEIVKEVLGEDDLLTYRSPRLKQELIEELDQVLGMQLQNDISINPMSFLTGVNMRLEVERVFTEVRMTHEDPGGAKTSLDYLDLLNVVRSGPGAAQPQVLLVSGVAGSGKTTLGTLVTNEWLKSEDARTLRGLQHYDLLLRVQCRERRVTSLKQLLQTHMPAVFLKFRSLFLPLIKQCNVLLLIDGLDEATEDSKELIDDILTQMSTVAGCTLLCTSRPHSVIPFASTIPQRYRITCVELCGIPEACRAPFIRRYHEEVKQQTGRVQDTDEFVLTVKQVVAREQFRLPINLVFLTWVYLYNPAAVTATTTQTELYHNTNQLCVHKLLDRLARHTTTRTTGRRPLEARLKECQAQLHRECLLALWHSQLSLSGDAEERIRTTCDTHGVPPEELLSGFLCLKATRSYNGVLEHEYSAPHKGLQEYYAALHLAADPTLTAASGSIRDVLQAALGTPELHLTRLQNVLHHVVGLLCLRGDSVPQPVLADVVEAVHEAGVGSREQWLDLLEDTRATPAILHAMARHFPTGPDHGDIEVTDARVESYKALLPHLAPARIRIVFKKERGRLEELLPTLSRHTCTRLHLHHDYRDPRSTLTCDLLLHQVLPRCDLMAFRGHLSVSSLAQLPASLQYLSLALTSDLTSSRLLQTLPHLPRLQLLHIHVTMAEMALTSLTPLPDIGEEGRGGGVKLLLSGVEDQHMEEVWRVAKGLQPPSGYLSIRFPRGRLTAAGWQRLLRGLAGAGVAVAARGRVVLPVASTTHQQGVQLCALTLATLKCSLYRLHEEELWQ